MATVVEDWSFSDKPGPVRYDWDSWLDGRVWRLVHGEDFHISTKNFRNSVFVASGKRGLRVRTALGENGSSLMIQAMRT